MSIVAPPTSAGDFCRIAADIVEGDRQQDYGDKLRNHQNIATMWNAYLICITDRLNDGLTPRDVSTLMELLKIARSTFGRDNPDNYIDRVGYAAITGELAQLEGRGIQ